jgi:hypothetical protein
MIVVAFTFAIWSYVKTNQIKNSNSPSVPNVINDNNTYVNNIASAPNTAIITQYDSSREYELQTTDNGTTFYCIPSPGTVLGNLIFNLDTSKLPFGFYVNIINASKTLTLHFVCKTDAISESIDLAPGEYACVGNHVTEIFVGGGGGGLISGIVVSNGTIV